jgi:hypothetical protein
LIRRETGPGLQHWRFPKATAFKIRFEVLIWRAPGDLVETAVTLSADQSLASQVKASSLVSKLGNSRRENFRSSSKNAPGKCFAPTQAAFLM